MSAIIRSNWLILASITVSVLACGKNGQNLFHVDVLGVLEEGRDIEMVSMPGGTYAMGSDLYSRIFYDTVSLNPTEIDTLQNAERPIHYVRLSSFLIASTEITQEQYAAVMGVNPAHFRNKVDMPVESVTWFAAADYCNGLSELLGYTPCYDREYNCDFSADGFRLPTESEWEYAARAGTDTEYSNGNDQAGMILACWYGGNSEGTTHKVATKEPNAAGIYDMHGNVTEWCQDHFAFYSCGFQTDPVGPARGALRIARGGSWAGQAADCRSAIRLPLLPELKLITVGFRIVRRP